MKTLKEIFGLLVPVFLIGAIGLLALATCTIEKKELETMEAPKCWGCGAEMEMKHYPASICGLCNRSGSAPEKRDLLKNIDNPKGRTLRLESVLKQLKIIVAQIEEELNGETR